MHTFTRLGSRTLKREGELRSIRCSPLLDSELSCEFSNVIGCFKLLPSDFPTVMVDALKL